MDRSALIKTGQADSLRWRSYAQRRAARLDLFRQLCESGKSRGDIAATLGVSEEHVYGHARNHGFPIPQSSRQRKRTRRDA